jgi:hypothetical protein
MLVVECNLSVRPHARTIQSGEALALRHVVRGCSIVLRLVVEAVSNRGVGTADGLGDLFQAFLDGFHGSLGRVLGIVIHVGMLVLRRFVKVVRVIPGIFELFGHWYCWWWWWL